MEVCHRFKSTALLIIGFLTFPCYGKGDEPIIERQEVGERALDFELPIVGSKDYLKLSEHYRRGPVVVVVLRGYPGYQCPVCVRQVATIANRASALRQAAEKVILVYPGDTESLERRAEQFAGARRLPEPLVIVRDDGMEMIREWGLRWDERKETAYPATYVIDRNGRIRWMKVSQSHAGRSTVEEMLRELRKL